MCLVHCCAGHEAREEAAGSGLLGWLLDGIVHHGSVNAAVVAVDADLHVLLNLVGV